MYTGAQEPTVRDLNLYTFVRIEFQSDRASGINLSLSLSLFLSRSGFFSPARAFLVTLVLYMRIYIVRYKARLSFVALYVIIKHNGEKDRLVQLLQISLSF